MKKLKSGLSATGAAERTADQVFWRRCTDWVGKTCAPSVWRVGETSSVNFNPKPIELLSERCGSNVSVAPRCGSPERCDWTACIEPTTTIRGQRWRVVSKELRLIRREEKNGRKARAENDIGAHHLDRRSRGRSEHFLCQHDSNAHK